MFKRQKKYQELIKSKNAYDVKQFAINHINSLSEEQRYKIILMAKKELSVATNLLVLTDIVHFTTEERIILLQSVIDKNVENVLFLINDGFMFSKTELDLVVGSVIRNKSSKVAKSLCSKYALPLEISDILSSMVVM